MGRYKITTACLLFVLLVTLTATAQGAGTAPKKSLTDIYKTGKVELVSKFELTADTMPVPTQRLCWLHPGPDYLYVVDIGMNNVKILTHKGEFIETFGRLGKGPSDLDTPGKITHAGNNVVVWEAGNRRFSIFSKDGKFVKSSKMEHAGYCRIIKSLDNGDVVLERVKTVRENKKYIQLVSLDLYSPDMEFKKILYRQKVYRMNYINRKNIIVPFAPDIYWDVAPGNKIVVGFSDQYKLKIIDTEKMDDKPFSHAYTPIKVTEADKEDFFSGITWGASGETTKRGASKFTREHTEFPEYKPAFRGVLCDPEGNILVVCTNGGTDLNAKYLDAFDSSGTFISRVEVVNKNGLSLLLGYQFSKDKHLWTVERRDDVDSVIVKYKLK